MFGRKSKVSDTATKSKAIKSSHLATKSASDCGGRCTKGSAKASDMTSGGRSTKSCGVKSTAKATKAYSTRATSSKASSGKSTTSTKSCS